MTLPTFLVVLLVVCLCVLGWITRRREDYANQLIDRLELHIEMLNRRLDHRMHENSRLHAQVDDLAKRLELEKAKLYRFLAETRIAAERYGPYAAQELRLSILKEFASKNEHVFIRNLSLTPVEEQDPSKVFVRSSPFFRYSMELANPFNIPAELWIDELVEKVRAKVIHDFAILNKPAPKELDNADPSR